mgnify:CR=1 FL=1
MILGVVSPSLFSEDFKRFVDLIHNEDVVVEVRFATLDEFTQTSLISLVDVFDYLDMLDVKVLRLPRLENYVGCELRELIEKAIMIADDIGAKFLIIPYSASHIPHLKKLVSEIYRELLEYGKTLCFEPGFDNFTSLDTVLSFMKYLDEEYSQSPFAISYDIGSSYDRPVLNDIFDLISYLRIIHVCNVTSNGRRIPLFKSNGEINPYELLNFLLESRYTEYLLLSYEIDFIHTYISDIFRIKQYVISYFERI